MANRLSTVFLSACFAALTPEANADTVSGTVENAHMPLANVVITATPTANGKSISANGNPIPIKLDQKGKEFVPHVLAIKVGTPVYFPNSDDIQHHVYSFSQAKRFEIKLYKGTPSAPILFNQPGVVALGCNIHDWMLGFVFVTESPYFAISDDAGRWTLDLPSGDYQLSLWHPDAAVELPPQTLHVPLEQSLHHVIDLKMSRRTGKPPGTLQAEGYADGF
jgi:plastocyanin